MALDRPAATYGGFSFLPTGDLNDQSERILTRAHSEGLLDLSAEVLKAPHHGSGRLLTRVPQVGRANHLSHLERRRIRTRGIYSSPCDHRRCTRPIFARARTPDLLHRTGRLLRANRLELQDKDQRSGAPRDEIELDDEQARYYGFSRTAYGMVKIRTDGERLLVTTNSGKDDMKEAYAYQRNEDGEPMAVPVLQA